jgi:hypothetical protein
MQAIRVEEAITLLAGILSDAGISHAWRQKARN